VKYANKNIFSYLAPLSIIHYQRFRVNIAIRAKGFSDLQ
jgi:hypothetical protein